jgi:membrane protease YdiL (CAAX protease family)
MLVFFIAGYWAGTPATLRLVFRIALPIIFLIGTVASRRMESLQKYHRVSAGFLAASSAFLVSHWASIWLVRASGMSMDSVAGLAIAKLADALPIIVTILVVTRITGFTFEDLYLIRGRLAVWLIVGIGSFCCFFVFFVLLARDLGLGSDRILALLPWTLLFITSNGLMEELHFRGLLLKQLEQHLGAHSSNLCIALFFTLSHAPVRYAPDTAFFLPILFALALLWGYIIRWTGSLWGAVLFHAGADLLVIFNIYNSYCADICNGTPT